MEGAREAELTARFAAVIDWWREAGVDYGFADEPEPWLRPTQDDRASPSPLAAEPAPSAVEAPRPPIGGGPDAWPTELATFRTWWLTEPTLDYGQVVGRVPPRGEAGARLMVLVPHPEPDDREVLLSGAEGRLLTAFLAAAGYSPDSMYVASALPRCTPHPDWDALARDGLGEIVARHVALVGPERLLVFGSTISSLLNNHSAQNVPDLSPANHGETSVPTFVADELGILLARPLRKRTLWQRWLEWTTN